MWVQLACSTRFNSRNDNCLYVAGKKMCIAPTTPSSHPSRLATANTTSPPTPHTLPRPFSMRMTLGLWTGLASNDQASILPPLHLAISTIFSSLRLSKEKETLCLFVRCKSETKACIRFSVKIYRFKHLLTHMYMYAPAVCWEVAWE